MGLTQDEHVSWIKRSGTVPRCSLGHVAPNPSVGFKNELEDRGKWQPQGGGILQTLRIHN